MDPVRQETERGTWKETGFGEFKSQKTELTHVLWGTQDLPDFCDAVHASGQAKVNDPNVAQRPGTGQQDVLRLEKKPKCISYRQITQRV